ncbi:MAG: hypothetical protein K9J13_07775, partial [Saprospiraceae bacterium]|nr:hypothetical protein [Saprospiraceae bacterium]
FIAVILVGIIIASQFWPPTEDKDTSGTIGQELANMKNQKIKKTLLKDQQELTDIIEGLKYFNNFISQLTAHFDNNIKNLGEFKENDETKNCINRLEDFNNYIKANKFVVDNTIIMLTNLKENGEADNNDNYKKTLMEFDKFIYQMSIKDSVINNFIDESYVYIEKYGTLESRKHDINNLMSIVDNMVVKDMEYATVVKDDDKMTKGSDAELNIKEDTICKYKDQLKAAFSQEKLSIYDQMKSNIFLYDEDKLGLLPLFSIKNISVPEREPKETAEVTANNIN